MEQRDLQAARLDGQVEDAVHHLLCWTVDSRWQWKQLHSQHDGGQRERNVHKQAHEVKRHGLGFSWEREIGRIFNFPASSTPIVHRPAPNTLSSSCDVSGVWDMESCIDDARAAMDMGCQRNQTPPTVWSHMLTSAPAIAHNSHAEQQLLCRVVAANPRTPRVVLSLRLNSGLFSLLFSLTAVSSRVATKSWALSF